MTELFVLVDPEPIYNPTEEEERDYWNGVGSITFFVEQNTDDVFEIFYEDSSGCVGGATEMFGYEYFLSDILCLEIDEFKEGFTYTVHGINVYWTSGDGWEIDDDVEYNYETITHKIEFMRYIKQKLYNFWWQNIGWRIRNG